MNPLQMRQYLMLSTDRERSRWIRRFWVELDPTPTSDENEAPHRSTSKRIEMARELFRSRGAPGWDDRGEIDHPMGASELPDEDEGRRDDRRRGLRPARSGTTTATP